MCRPSDHLLCVRNRIVASAGLWLCVPCMVFRSSTQGLVEESGARLPTTHGLTFFSSWKEPPWSTTLMTCTSPTSLLSRSTLRSSLTPLMSMRWAAWWSRWGWIVMLSAPGSRSSDRISDILFTEKQQTLNPYSHPSDSGRLSEHVRGRDSDQMGRWAKHVTTAVLEIDLRLYVDDRLTYLPDEHGLQRALRATQEWDAQRELRSRAQSTCWSTNKKAPDLFWSDGQQVKIDRCPCYIGIPIICAELASDETYHNIMKGADQLKKRLMVTPVKGASGQIHLCKVDPSPDLQGPGDPPDHEADGSA